MARKYKATIATPHGPRTCFEARTERPGRKPLVARFGGIPLQAAEARRSSMTARQSRPPARKEARSRLGCVAAGGRVRLSAHAVR